MRMSQALHREEPSEMSTGCSFGESIVDAFFQRDFVATDYEGMGAPETPCTLRKQAFDVPRFLCERRSTCAPATSTPGEPRHDRAQRRRLCR